MLLFWVVVASNLLIVCPEALHCRPVEEFASLEEKAIHCNSTAPVCNLTLTVEMLQTMVSYESYSSGGRSPRGHRVYVNQSTGHICRADGKAFFPNLTAPITADGHSRMVLTLNGQTPGPMIIAYQGQIIQVKVVNQLQGETVSIHWHGMHQRGNHWMDGIGRVTQCPILPGTNFTYTFIASEVGTHWYHSHTAAQRSDGLYGALIVLQEKRTNNSLVDEPENNSLVDEPERFTLMLLDWYKDWGMDVFLKIHTTVGYYPQGEQGGRYENTVGPDGTDVGGYPFWSALINGRGRHYYTSTRGKCVSNASPLHTFTVERKKQYRWRVIGAQSNYAFRLSIEGHQFQVVSADGFGVMELTQPVDYLHVHSGERYDVVMATSAEPGCYWIRAETLEVNAKDVCSGHHHAEAVLEYTETGGCGGIVRGGSDGVRSGGAGRRDDSVKDIKRECTNSEPCTAVNCPFENYAPHYNIRCVNVYQLSPVHTDPPPSSGSLQEIFLNFGFHGTRQILRSTVNGISFKHPSTVVGMETNADNGVRDHYCNRDTNCLEEHCHCTHMVNVTAGSVVQVVLSNLDQEKIGSIAHPIHLHGHSFHVMHIGYPTYNSTTGYHLADNEDLECADKRCSRIRWRNKVEWNLMRPRILKDTITVPAGGYVVIRLVADNPGVWFLHCHIVSHHLEGMALILNEAARLQEPAPRGFPKCSPAYERDLADFQQTQSDISNISNQHHLHTHSSPGAAKSTNTVNPTPWIHCAKMVAGSLLVGSIVVYFSIMWVVFHFSSRRQQKRVDCGLCVIFPSCSARRYQVTCGVSLAVTTVILVSLIVLEYYINHY